MCKIQCFCLTNSGTRCKRYCSEGSLKCFQHEKMNHEDIRILPSIDFTQQTQKPEPKTFIVFDLTNSPPTRSNTRSVQLNSAVEQTMESGNTRIERQTMQVDQELLARQNRVKPITPRRPIKKPIENKSSSHCEDCCICYDQKVEEDRFLACGHALCPTCISSLRSDKCPLCRKEVESKYISKTEKKRMQRRKRDDDEERNEESYENYMRTLVQESGANAALFVNFIQ